MNAVQVPVRCELTDELTRAPMYPVRRQQHLGYDSVLCPRFQEEKRKCCFAEQLCISLGQPTSSHLPLQTHIVLSCPLNIVAALGAIPDKVALY